ncbi:MAG TPA: CRTAC1 family protein, partial [Pirellulaceae bacterium]|nr:CRTAC1 family protein [Pirellulaceae bacterium]
RGAAEIEIPAMPFADITQAAGIEFVHESGASGDKLLPETMGSGCAFLDYDNDGDQDLLFVNARRWPWDERPAGQAAMPALYQNDGSGKFQNVTANAGLDISFYGQGVACGDYDGDGRVDLYFTAVGKGKLLRNTGERFEDVTEAAGVGGNEGDWGTSCGWFDYDRDGDLDLFVCNYLAWSRQADVSQDFQLIGGGRAYGRPQNFGGTFCTLHQNQGDGTFRDVSQAAGIQIQNPDTKVPAGKSLGLAFADFDDDGFLDVVVANDTVGNFLLHNQRDGTFEEIGSPAGVAYDTSGMARGAMGIDVAHFRNNREQGIAIGNFSNEMTALYVNQGDAMHFRDDAVSNGLGPATRLELTFGLFFFDADLDGRLDLFSANGHLEEDIHRVQATQHYAQPPHFFWNCGPERKPEFEPVPAEKCGPDLLVPMVGRGAACADIDGDGDLDIAVTATGGPARLLRNDQQLGHHWLRVKLEGKAPNTGAIGAAIELHQGNSIQRRLASPTRSYLSQCELPLTFGLGADAQPTKLIVRWPDGKITERTDFAIDRQIILQQP